MTKAVIPPVVLSLTTNLCKGLFFWVCRKWWPFSWSDRATEYGQSGDTTSHHTAAQGTGWSHWNYWRVSRVSVLHSPPPIPKKSRCPHTRTHTHTHTLYIYIYMYITHNLHIHQIKQSWVGQIDISVEETCFQGRLENIDRCSISNSALTLSDQAATTSVPL